MPRQHKHSQESLMAIINNGSKLTNAAKVFKFLRDRKRPLTDKQICKALSKPMATLQPRITDLLNDGVLIEDAQKKDPISGLPVRTVRIRNDSDATIEQEREIKADAMLEDLAKRLRKFARLKGLGITKAAIDVATLAAESKL